MDVSGRGHYTARKDNMSEQQESRDQVYDQVYAPGIIRRYVCAGCYGQLISKPIKGTRDEIVFCPQCGEHRGLVTRRFAEGRKDVSASELNEVTQVLQKAGVLPAPVKKTASQLLAELGF